MKLTGTLTKIGTFNENYFVLENKQGEHVCRFINPLAQWDMIYDYMDAPKMTVEVVADIEQHGQKEYLIRII